MDESVRIYEPKFVRELKWAQPEEEQVKHEEPAAEPVNVARRSHLRKQSKNSKWKFFFDEKLWKKILEEKEAEIRRLDQKHPWVQILCRWTCAALCIVLVLGLIGWGIDIHTNRIAETFAATALADYQADQDAKAAELAAQAEAERRSEQVIMAKEAQDGARAIYGIRNFIDKYGYSKEDLKTYIRCILDRIDFGGGVNDFHAIVSQAEQFLGYSDKNPVLEEYYKIAMEEIAIWHHEESKPWDVSYRFAELTSKGIYLTDTFGADGYARRVRY